MKPADLNPHFKHADNESIFITKLHLWTGWIYSAHVLLNLLNKLRKRDIEFNKFSNTEARMLDSIFHMTLRLLKSHIFGVKTSRFYHFLSNVIMDVITLALICKLVFYRFYCMAFFHSQTQRHVIKRRLYFFNTHKDLSVYL